MTGYKEPPKEHAFKPGNKANPGGKPIGARNRLQGKFLNQLADDFELYGKSAIVEMRETDPSAYIRCVASLMPKELEVTKPLDELSDDELAKSIRTLKQYLGLESTGDGGEEEDIE